METKDKTSKEMSIDEEIELFFQDPRIRVIPAESSILHLLRRDIYSCLEYINHDNKWVKSSKKDPTIWPGAMVVLAGIDLLGKFYAGCDDTQNGKVGIRFRKFYNKYIDNQNAEIIYQLRNSLLHSFGLYSKDTYNSKIYNFNLCINNTKFVEEYSETLHENDENGKKYTILFYRIDLYILHDLFEKSIEKYRIDLMADKTDLKDNFHKMFKTYGMAH